MTEAEIKSRLNFKNLDIEDHAVQRAKQRLKRKDREDALNYVRALLGQSRYIGVTTCDRGNSAHMFVAPNKLTIYLSLDLSCIKTIIPANEKPYIVYDNEAKEIENEEFQGENVFDVTKDIPLQDKLIKLYQKEFKKYDRMEKKMDKEFTECRLVKLIEIAELNYKIYKTKSKKMKEELSEKVKEIESIITSNMCKLKKVQDDKRKISKVLASLLKV